MNKLSGDVYYPSDEVVRLAHVKNWEELSTAATSDHSAFWAKEASELHWFRKWDRVMDDSKPFYKWFVGAEREYCV
jgi:acetyl-CoA synthetase